MYHGRIQAMMEREETRLMVSINDLRDRDPALAALTLTRPLEYIPVLEEAVKDVSGGARVASVAHCPHGATHGTSPWGATARGRRSSST